jgi:hypothetical protein
MVEPYSPHFIFFVTHEWACKARVLHDNRVESLAEDKQSNLLVQLINYEEKEVL